MKITKHNIKDIPTSKLQDLQQELVNDMWEIGLTEADKEVKRLHSTIMDELDKRNAGTNWLKNKKLRDKWL